MDTRKDKNDAKPPHLITLADWWYLVISTPGRRGSRSRSYARERRREERASEFSGGESDQEGERMDGTAWCDRSVEGYS